jgi:acetamidase/formamidase
MDTPEMRAGTSCYLGVNVEGALFSLGDGHARQGEGETCGVAVECAMDTVLVVDNYTVVAKLAKRHLRGATIMDGSHERMRRTRG